MSVAFLSLGSNLGDRMGNLKKAMSLLSSHPSITILKVSSVYETDPVGYTKQDDFLNLVCRIETDLPPLTLLEYIRMVEQILKRERTIRFGPRTMDIDILTYDQLVLTAGELILPHPRMRERAFVQIPLREILSGKEDAADQGVPPQEDKSVRYFGRLL